MYMYSKQKIVTVCNIHVDVKSEFNIDSNYTYCVPHNNIDIGVKTSIHVLSDVQVYKITKVVIQVDS